MKNRASTPSLEELLAHSGWVRALARNLVADGSAADDVEQQVWLTALEKPPKHARNLKAWLSSVVRSVVGQRHRDVERRQRYDRRMRANAGESAPHPAHNRADFDAARGDGSIASSPPPDAIASRMETFQALAALVSELEEPYGSAVYLRYFEDLSVAEVGQRLGVPTNTAQTRLHRGVEKLRTRMKARFGLDWKQRCVIFLAPLNAVPVPVATVTLLAMSAKTKWAVAAAVLLAIPLFQVFLADPATDDTSMVEEAAVPAVVENSNEGGGGDLAEASPVAEQRTESEVAPEASPSGSASHQLTVLHAGSLQPAAHVEVLYFDRGKGRDKEFSQAKFRQRSGVEGALDQLADRYQTDANGHVELPPRTSYTWVAARTEEQYAQLYMLEDLASASYEEIELLLQPRLDIEVEVVDELGKPVADIPVVYQTQYAPGHGNNMDKALTDENGVATLANMQVRFQDANTNNQHLIAVDLPLNQKLQHLFDLNHPPTERLHFQLPATTQVEVRPINADGTALRDGAPVRLHTDFIETPSGKKSSVFKMSSGQDASLAYVKDGVALFPYVGQNLAVVAGARFQGAGLLTAAGRTGSDPNFALRIDIRSGVDAVTYQTQLVRPDGSPVGNATIDMDVMLQLEDALAMPGISRKQYGERRATKAEGWLTFSQENHRSFILLTHTSKQPGLVEWGFLHVSEPVQMPVPSGDPTARRIELKPVVMGEELIVSGTVKNSAGQALPNAYVELRLPWVPAIHGNPAQEWEFIYLQTRADEAGQFTIRGTLNDPSGLLGWSAHHKPDATNTLQLTLAPNPDAGAGEHQVFEFESGKANQIFQLQSSAALSGRIQLDPGITPRDLTLRLHFTPAESSDTQILFEQIDATSGKYRFAGLKPGSAELRLYTAMTHELVASSQPFDIPAKGDVTPAEWRSLDLRGHLHPHTVNATAADGTPIEEINISYQHDQSIWSANRRTPVHFITTQPQTLIRISAQGHQSSPLLVVGRTHTESLFQAIPLQVHLPKTTTLPANTQWQIMARQPQSIQQLATWTPEAAARIHPGQNTTTLQLPAAGSWQIALVYCGQGTGPIDPYAPRALANLTTNQSTHEIQISPTQQNQSITLPLTDDAIQKITAHLSDKNQ
jgi:RNA polymerase sigma factor (sigma-70 family)